MNDFTTEDYIKYKLQKARDTISEVGILIDNQLWDTAVNRIYYACFYAVSSILLSKGIKTSTHTGCLQKFGEHFINTGLISKELGKHYSKLHESRLQSDYDDFIDIDERTALEFLEPSKELIEIIEKLVREENS